MSRVNVDAPPWKEESESKDEEKEREKREREREREIDGLVVGADVARISYNIQICGTGGFLLEDYSGDFYETFLSGNLKTEKLYCGFSLGWGRGGLGKLDYYLR